MPRIGSSSATDWMPIQCVGELTKDLSWSMSMCSSSSIASWILFLANSLISAIGAASGFSGPSTSSSVSEITPNSSLRSPTMSGAPSIEIR